jgi:KipI family sensor histidine kinase inhibitor
VIDRLDVREAGDGALLFQLPAVIDPAINARVLAIAGEVRKQKLRGVRDVVSTFHSVAVHFDPLQADVEEIAVALREAATASPRQSSGRRHEIPVAYGGEDGPDLELVAAHAGVSQDDVIRRHASVPYRVFMLGFQPGFAYLGLVDPLLAVPRRPSPRVRVPAGSVGIAGRQTAVYPAASPGGWQLVGRALEPVFDIEADAPRFAPGDTVCFVSSRAVSTSASTGSTRAATGEGARRVTVVSPGLFTSIQDGGRWGRQDVGFPVSGAMDPASHAFANIMVGNDADAAALEVTIAGPELRVEQQTTVAVSGADLTPTLDGAAVPSQTPVSAAAGSVLRFGPRRLGARAYVAFDGGIRPATRWPVKPLAAGDVLTLNPAPARAPIVMVRRSSLPAGGARLRVMIGPQDHVLPRECLDVLLSNRFTVSSQSNRMGYRLAGPTVPGTPGEMISDATFAGGIQVTPSGEPILLMADRQTTGGYPQAAVVISADLPAAAQLVPGDWVEFVACTRNDAVSALRSQQSMITHVR